LARARCWHRLNIQSKQWETVRSVGFAGRNIETARNIDRGGDVKIAHAQCSMAKLYSSEMAGRVADRAVQVFGGRGYMRENVAERFYRELRVERIWEGTSEVQRAIIADQMVKRGPGALA
jgi:acyl-CoA dehydrogenase